LVGDKKEESGIFISPSIQERGDFPHAIHIHIKNAHIQSGKMDLRKIQNKELYFLFYILGILGQTTS
jgi:hypothetical protein